MERPRRITDSPARRRGAPKPRCDGVLDSTAPPRKEESTVAARARAVNARCANDNERRIDEADAGGLLADVAHGLQRVFELRREAIGDIVPWDAFLSRILREPLFTHHLRPRRSTGPISSATHRE